MAVINLFRTKKKKVSSAPTKEKAEVLSTVSKSEGTVVRTSSLFKHVILAPVISEKAAMLKETQNAYLFIVDRSATKVAIRHELEREYKVKVRQVRIVNVRQKPKRLGKYQGYRSGYKKAIVYLKPGYKIDLV